MSAGRGAKRREVRPDRALTTIPGLDPDLARILAAWPDLTARICGPRSRSSSIATWPASTARATTAPAPWRPVFIARVKVRLWLRAPSAGLLALGINDGNA